MLSDSVYLFEYNAMNMLSKVKDASTNRTVEQYWYTPDGQRVKKVIYLLAGGNQTTYYVVGDYETAVNASGVREDTSYVFANGERVATLYENGSKSFFLNDHLGSSSVIINEAGQLLDRMTYYPYGAIRAGGGTSKFGYNSKELDGTGLDYYGARYYNPQLKRWTQVDTIIEDVYNPQTLNGFSYVRNNPIRYTDPSGHCIEDACVVEIAGVTITGSVITAGVLVGSILDGIYTAGSDYLSQEPQERDGLKSTMKGVGVMAGDMGALLAGAYTLEKTGNPKEAAIAGSAVKITTTAFMDTYGTEKAENFIEKTKDLAGNIVDETVSTIISKINPIGKNSAQKTILTDKDIIIQGVKTIFDKVAKKMADLITKPKKDETKSTKPSSPVKKK